MQNTESFTVIFRAETVQGIDPYVEELKQLEIPAAVIPVMHFNYCNIEKLEKILMDHDLYCGMIFTSTRSVKAVSCVFKNLPEECLNEWKTKRNFAVGEATKCMADSELGISTIGESSGNSKALSQVIVNTCPASKKAFIFPCSSSRRDTLIDILLGNGIDILEIPCYDIVPNPSLKDKWEELVFAKGLPEILVFFSPSGVQFVLEIFQTLQLDLTEFKVAAIGPTTGEALFNAGCKLCAVATKPTPKELCTAINLKLKNEK